MKLVMVVGVVIAAVLGLMLSTWQMEKMGTATGAGGGSPTAIVDSVAVKTDLLTIAGALKQQFALEGKYVPLDELRTKGVPIPEKRGAYVYTADVTDMTFLVKATYVAPDGSKPQPPLTIGPDMKVQ
jgi:hypothetical protein